MKVIFLQNIKGTAQIGEIKEVSDGYARNFLFPRKMAQPATADAVKQAEAAKRKWNMMFEIEKKRAEEAFKDVSAMIITLKRKASSKGTLYDGVEKRDIAEKLREMVSVRIDEDMLKLDEPIKHVGSHTVEIEPAPGVKGQLNVTIVAEE